MKKTSFILMAFFCLIFISSSNAQKRESVNVDNFSGVVLRTGGNVYIKQGKESRVEIETSDEIREMLDVFVEKGSLVIEFQRNTRNWNMRGNNPLNIYITMNELNKLSISSSGHIRTENKFKTDNLDLKISGSGTIEVAADANNINADISGSGTIRMKGSSNTLNPKISGSGRIEGEELIAKSSNIKISGSGNCSVNVSESLDANISGSGNVYYSGSPNNVNSSVAGSGKIRKVN